MKNKAKILIYLAIALAIVIGLCYFFGSNGLLASLIGLLGFGGKKYSDQMEALDKEIEEQEKDVKDLEKRRENLELKDKTLEEEKEYWKKQ